MMRIIFFDFDGVLVESVDIKTKAFAKIFENEGKKTVQKIIEHHLNNTGVSRFEKFKYIYHNLLQKELTEEESRRLCRIFSDEVVARVVEAPYVPGAKDFLDAYAHSHFLYLLSATPQEEIEEIVRRRAMSSYFKGIYGAPQDKAKMVRGILKKNDSSPREAVYVGDSLSDYRAAQENAVHFIARIDRNEHLFRDIPCGKIKNLGQLREAMAIYA